MHTNVQTLIKKRHEGKYWKYFSHQWSQPTPTILTEMEVQGQQRPLWPCWPIDILIITFLLYCQACNQWIPVLLSPSVSTYTGGFTERRCFDTLKLLPHDQTSKYLPGQQRATPRQLTMQHLNISRMQSGWYTGEKMGGRRKQRSKAWTGEIMSGGARRRTAAAI